MSDMHASLRFDAEHLRRLAELQVTPEQVDELESVLPQCRAMLRDDPALHDVRDELLRLRKALVSAEGELARFDSLAERLPAISEALTRVALRDRTGDALGRASTSLVPAIFAIEKALRHLPSEQRRTNRALWGPVRLIAEALARSWTSAKPFPHVPSEGHSTKRPFRAVVGICYDAIGETKDSDPLRAIRGYLASERKQP